MDKLKVKNRVTKAQILFNWRILIFMFLLHFTFGITLMACLSHL